MKYELERWIVKSHWFNPRFYMANMTKYAGGI